MLGGVIGVVAPKRQCAEDIRRFLGPMATETYRTPDLLFLCTQRRASRYLFRARPLEDGPVPLEGVYLRRPGDGDWSPWTCADPPLPPLSIPPFSGRFVALHAACVCREDVGGVLLVGDRGAGKTTVALALAQRHGFEFLTDETAFLRVRSLVVEPFPRALGIFTRNGGVPRKRDIRADRAVSRIRMRPCVVARIVFLESRPGRQVRIRNLEKHRALTSLLSAARRSGVGIEETTISLFELVRAAARTLEISYSSYEQLTELPDALLEALVAK